MEEAMYLQKKNCSLASPYATVLHKATELSDH